MMSEEIISIKEIIRKSRFDLLCDRPGHVVEIPIKNYTPTSNQKNKDIQRHNELSNFSSRTGDEINFRIKDKLYETSLIRNKFKIRPLADGEFSIIRNKKGVYCISEQGDTAVKALATRNNEFFIPLFEISSNPEFLYKNFENLSLNESINYTVNKCYPAILKAEDDIYNKLMNSRNNYKGTLFIRTDLHTLPANEFFPDTPEKDLIGWSIFENIAIAIYEG